MDVNVPELPRESRVGKHHLALHEIYNEGGSFCKMLIGVGVLIISTFQRSCIVLHEHLFEAMHEN